MTTRSDLLTVREFFSSDEWDLIDAALSEYQDHYDTDEEAATYNTLVGRIAHLFTINTDVIDGEPIFFPSLFLLLFFIMRKIEQQMITAINNNQDWQSGNTSVHFNEENSVSIVRLHGNKIAEVGDDYLTLFDGDHQTKTTKSRLNAILGEFGYTCGTKREYVFQKQFEWFVNFFNMKSNQIEVVPFVDGMVLTAGCTIDLVMSLNSPTVPNTFVFVIMSRSTALGMLRVGNTGNEILSILDVIVADIESEKNINEIADMLFDGYTNEWLLTYSGYQQPFVNGQSL